MTVMTLMMNFTTGKFKKQLISRHISQEEAEAVGGVEFNSHVHTFLDKLAQQTLIPDSSFKSITLGLCNISGLGSNS